MNPSQTPGAHTLSAERGEIDVTLTTTTTTTTKISEFPDGVSLLEYYVRPQEIQSCTWSVDKTGQPTKPCQCACDDLPDFKACSNGYVAVKRNVAQHILEKSPDEAIAWCVEHVPDKYKGSVPSSQSWTIGCFSGIHGVHKQF